MSDRRKTRSRTWHKQDPENFKAIKYIAREYGLSALAAFEEGMVRHRPIPPQLADRLFREDVPNITPNDIRILKMIAAGMKNKEIADELGRSENTLNSHIRRINSELGISSDRGSVAQRIKMINKARELGYIE